MKIKILKYNNFFVKFKYSLILFGLFLFLNSEYSSSSFNEEVKGSINDYVTFFGIGKVARYKQDGKSNITLLNPLFFAEVFLTVDGRVERAEIGIPRKPHEYHDLKYQFSESTEIGDVMYLSTFAETIQVLNNHYPSGNYLFNFDVPEGRVKSSIFFPNLNNPEPPRIIFQQEDKVIEFNSVDVDKELIISWTKFNEGASDNNHILDDLIFVAIDSCNIEDLVHSGRPFEKADYLTYEANQYVIPSGILKSGQEYTMYVDHALLPVTQIAYGVPAFATLATSTYMDFKTSGETDPSCCNSM